MLVRRNTKAFKRIADAIVKYADSGWRKKLIKLFGLRNEKEHIEAVPIDKSAKFSDVLYSMYYDQLVSNLKNLELKLFYREGEQPFFYFGKSEDDLQTPFQLAGKLKKEVKLS